MLKILTLLITTVALLSSAYIQAAQENNQPSDQQIKNSFKAANALFKNLPNNKPNAVVFLGGEDKQRLTLIQELEKDNAVAYINVPDTIANKPLHYFLYKSLLINYYTIQAVVIVLDTMQYVAGLSNAVMDGFFHRPTYDNNLFLSKVIFATSPYNEKNIPTFLPKNTLKPPALKIKINNLVNSNSKVVPAQIKAVTNLNQYMAYLESGEAKGANNLGDIRSAYNKCVEKDSRSKASEHTRLDALVSLWIACLESGEAEGANNLGDIRSAYNKWVEKDSRSEASEHTRLGALYSFLRERRKKSEPIIETDQMSIQMQATNLKNTQNLTLPLWVALGTLAVVAIGSWFLWKIFGATVSSSAPASADLPTTSQSALTTAASQAVEAQVISAEGTLETSKKGSSSYKKALGGIAPILFFLALVFIFRRKKEEDPAE